MNQETPTTTVISAPAKTSKDYLKMALAWIFSLAILFFFIWFISKAWKKGQQPA